MVERGLSDKLPRTDELKTWVPDEKGKAIGGEPRRPADEETSLDREPAELSLLGLLPAAQRCLILGSKVPIKCSAR